MYFYRYACDCDITFLVGNIKGGIKDFQVNILKSYINYIEYFLQFLIKIESFQIRGLIRIVMKPMLSIMPLIGGVQIFYLNNPTINFNLVGMADVLDLPGFKYDFSCKIIFLF